MGGVWTEELQGSEPPEQLRESRRKQMLMKQVNDCSMQSLPTPNPRRVDRCSSGKFRARVPSESLVTLISS